MQMRGLFIVNSFLSSDRFEDIYSLLINGAAKTGISLSCIKSGELLHSPEQLRRLPYDFILFWDKDTVLAEMLEANGYPVFNSAAAILACDNKAYTFMRLNKAGIITPETYASPTTFEGIGYCSSDFAERIAEKLSYPLILKEAYGSFGQQVYLIHNSHELNERLKALGCKSFIMQKFIAESSGKDVRINVVGDRAASSIMRFSTVGDFRSNIANGGSAKKFEPPETWKAAAIAASRAVGAEFAGVDILFGADGEPIVCEVNSNPQFRGSLECTGIDLSVLIFEHIKECLN